MKVKSISLIILSLFILIACEKNDAPGGGFEKLAGNWINPQVNDSTIKYDRSFSLKNNEYGFTIHQNGKFTERKNAGWCGTPPVSYSDFEGNWSINDSLLKVTVGYWGGLADYQWKIISLNDKRLTIVVISQDYKEN